MARCRPDASIADWPPWLPDAAFFGGISRRILPLLVIRAAGCGKQDGYRLIQQRPFEATLDLIGSTPQLLQRFRHCGALALMKLHFVPQHFELFLDGQLTPWLGFGHSFPPRTPAGARCFADLGQPTGTITKISQQPIPGPVLIRIKVSGGACEKYLAEMGYR
jgi:hypothetical protein